jgi:uncharacterized cupin superfamily protein
MSNTGIRVHRYVLAVTICALVGAFAAPAGAETGAKQIVRLNRAAKTTEVGKFPSENVVQGRGTFDGSYMGLVGYTSDNRKFTVGLWESGPGTLQSDAYPHDEYCLVLEGHLIVTNRSGQREEFDPGDTFVIPKGWAGTWDMTTRLKKQYVAFEEAPASPGR